MARYKKKDYLETVKLLKKMNRLLSEGDWYAIDAVLAITDCQEAAIALGMELEWQGDAGMQLTHLLEEYCENLYQLSEKFHRNEGLETCSWYIKVITQQLDELEKGIRENLPDRKEIVFFPYKASMWDSLESIWQAASEDPECFAYVVPIPYFDRNPDGSFGTWHYEGEDFPESVPIVHYDEYDLGKRRPDIIYIHNPYDDHNLVTSVEPRYYSIELRKYTDCLVYVPYCVYPEPDNPDSPQTIDWCSRYITPVMINADKIILQSKNFRKAMINTLVANYGESRDFWENKIIGLGSPKYDKILLADEMSLDIPDDWKKIIWKQDGEKKKVVFYNTSLAVTLRDTEQELKKIESVINFFYEIRDKFVLLWRPHPLMKATIDSMRTELSVRYQKIVDVYKNGGWGIYDDTPSYHTAFALSDAYYGDSSSLAHLYKATGKPLLLQCAEITDYTRRFVTTCSIYYDGNDIWFVAREFNGLFKMDSETHKKEFVGHFPGEYKEGYTLYGEIAEGNEKLYFAPYNAKNIAVYNKEKRRFYTIPLRADICDIDKKFFSTLTCGKYVFIQGHKVNTIIRIDSETDETVYFEDKSMITGNGQYFTTQSCVHNGKVYFYHVESNSFLCLNSSDMSGEYLPLNRQIDSEVVILGHTVLMFKEHLGGLIYYNFETSEFCELPGIDYAKCLCESDKYIYIFSNHVEDFYRLDKETGEICVFQGPKDISKCCLVGNNIIVSTNYTGQQYIINTDNMEQQSIGFEFDEKGSFTLSETKMLEEKSKNNKIAYEFGSFHLRQFLEVVKTGLFENKKINQGNGSKIHEYVKGIR